METTEKALVQEINDTKKHLEELQRKLFNHQNKELFDCMEANIGKCFLDKAPGRGVEKIIKINGIDKTNKLYLITSACYDSMLIGEWHMLFSNTTMYYDKLSQYKEITKEDYESRLNSDLNFVVEALSKNK